MTSPPPPPPPPSAATYELSRDFSITANPNGAWSYGWESTLGGIFGVLPYLKRFASDNGVPLADWQLDSTTAPVIARNMGSTTAVSAGGHFTGPPGTVWMNPGFDGRPENFGVIRFKVPAGQPGTYKVETSVRSLFDTDFSADADFHVLKNGTEVFGEFMVPNSSTGYSNVFRLGPSDTIDFAIGRGADGISGNTGLKIQAAVTRVFTSQITIAGLCHLGQFAFTLNADEGANYDIDASEDLVHWTRLTGITNCPASISITDTDSENFPNRFYRARVVDQ